MRILITAILLLLIKMFSISQPDCDIATSGISVTPNTISVGQSTVFEFDIFNDALGTTCCYEDSSIEVLISLPADAMDFDSVVSPAGGSGQFFDWVYLASDRVISGINHTEVCDTDGEIMTFRVTATALPFYPQTRQIVASITNYIFGPPFPSNDPANDNGIAVLQINAPLPIELTSMKAMAESCNHVRIFWETASEVNNDYVEIQRSDNGVSFETIGKKTGTNQTTTVSYEFLDSDHLKDGVVYYYRLRQVDYDGKVVIHNPVTVRTNTCSHEKSVSVHPNPVLNELSFRYRGFEGDELLECTIINSVGQAIQTVGKVSVSDLNNLDVSSLVPGMYNIKVDTRNEVFIHKFVKI